ncbi:MAG: MBL fold metallo-hydrolase [Phycisphaerales bacterium]|nr:MBL fold metallo-hydrolase [Phycisphaerales bacterium]
MVGETNITPRLTVLGSGSRGNASVLVCGRDCILIDAGLSPRRVHRACADMGLPRPNRIVLTHPDSDHLYRSWATWVNRGEVALHVHEGHVDAVARTGFQHAAMQTFSSTFHAGGLLVQVALADHDDEGTCVFRMQAADTTIGWATDIGRATERIRRHLSGVKVLAIESNYDRKMQESSDRPFFLKQRIMGGAGHLSNTEALETVLDTATDDTHTIALLHLSQQCNCPMVVRSLWQTGAPHLVDRLVIASQHEPVHVLGVMAKAN